ncbi:MAG: glutamate-5-semialdehyde dehydrogenase [Coriobacteriia bacterium]|nr:glutamate-5-semialdehyde dehydrogenase [Coriobacteriia bacterium]
MADTLTTTAASSVKQQAQAAKQAAQFLAAAPIEVRNGALAAMSEELLTNEEIILAANMLDIDAARAEGIHESMIDRLTLNPERLAGCRQALAELIAFSDVLGEVIEGRTIAQGIRMKQVRVPLGVVGMIYEARPNVTIDAASIAIKTGNTILLRGGKIAQQTNDVLVDVLRKALVKVGLPDEALQNLDATSRDSAHELMGLHGLVDVLIPRGGAGLIKNVVENSKVPVIETGTGNCHVYLHEAADLEMALSIVMNAKTQRPSVCNAAESLLIDDWAAKDLFPSIAMALADAGTTLVCDEASKAIAAAAGVPADLLRDATEEDWGTEYLDMTISVKLVSDIDEAIAHIDQYGSSHSEAIVTDDYAAAQKFSAGVDAAAVYVNASTRFCDGGLFGLGAEIGISTQKLHARGPMGVKALTSTKYILEGSGQIR